MKKKKVKRKLKELKYYCRNLDFHITELYKRIQRLKKKKPKT